MKHTGDGLEKFCKTTMDTLNQFAPIKKKHGRGGQIPFIFSLKK